MATAATTAPYLDAFDATAEARVGEPDAVGELRTHGRDRFRDLGFPSVREEEWRYTNVAPLARRDFRPVAPGGSVSSAFVDELSYPDCDRLVFVDGRLDEGLSRLAEAPPGGYVGSLRAALRGTDGRVAENLGRYTSVEERAFVALNTALFVDGAAVVIPRGAVVERPLQVIFVASEQAEGRAIYTRNLYLVEEQGQATIIETFAARANEYFHSVVGETGVAAGGYLDHYKMQRESTGAFHIAAQEARVERAAVLRSHSISLGGGLVRNDINAVLAGEGVDVKLDGLYVATGDQLVDTHMRVEHAAPHGSSHELYKGILDGSARAVFNGRIFVHEGAQKTDAKQTNRNLLLSKDALCNSNPQLEIFADDVKCTHGSTVGELDEEAIFYLRSRGIEEDAARSLLTYAFASEVAEGIQVEAVRQDLEEFLFGRLASGEVVRQAV